STHHHHPPSFPTRRSSDLTRRPKMPDIHQTLRRPASQHVIGPISARDQIIRGGISARPRKQQSEHRSYEQPTECPHPVDPFGQRSEEHTSELQSLTNLVCR